MRKRPLGTSGPSVSEIGFGAWQLGNNQGQDSLTDADAHCLVRTAIDQGINLFDTAPHYAATNSERLLGEALEGSRADVVLVSKFGHVPDGGRDFGVESFWSSLEASLGRLRTDYLDVLLLHNPPGQVLSGEDPLWDALEEASKQGRIRHYGVSLDLAREAETCLRNTGTTVLEVLFNVLHQDIRRAFGQIRESGVGVIAKVPLDSGWLTGRFDASHRFTGVRSRWTAAQIAQRAQLIERLEWLTAEGAPLAHRSLAYLLSCPEVSCVIPGMRTIEQVGDNAAAIGCVMSDEDRRRLEEFWVEVTDEGTNLLPW